jgi:hypothetical protein
MISAARYIKKATDPSRFGSSQRMLDLLADQTINVTLEPHYQRITQDRIREYHYLDSLELIVDSDFKFVNLDHDVNSEITFRIYDHQRPPPAKLFTVSSNHAKGILFIAII